MKKVAATKIEITKGYYMGEEGIGYDFDLRPQGDISVATRGYYQGYQSPTELLIPDNAKIAKSKGGEMLMYGGPWVAKDGYLIDWPLHASEAVALGIASEVSEAERNYRPAEESEVGRD